MTIEIEPLGGPFGVRITGLDLSKTPDEGALAVVEAAFRETPMLVFPGQTGMPIEVQVALVGRFATVLEERLPGDRHSFVSNDDGHGTDDMNAGYREGPLTPHMDYTYTPYPADVISLFALAVPDGGTHTRFYSNVRPLEVMPEALRREIDGYSILCAHDLARMRPDARPAFEGRTDPDAPTQSRVWPLVRRHPKREGVDFLMCTLQQTERILELSDEANGDRESRALLGRLFDEYLYVPENEWVHRWQPGDLVVWDNLALQHGREACPRSHGARSLRRVAGCDAGNAIRETVAFLGLADSSVAFADDPAAS